MIYGYTESVTAPVLNIRKYQHPLEDHQSHSFPRSSLATAGMSQRRDLEESTGGDAPAQDSATWAEDNVPQADTCSCALPCSLPIPRDVLLSQGIPSSPGTHSSPCCCTGRQCPGRSRAAAGAGLGWQLWEEPSWQGREHSPGHPCPEGIFLGVSPPWHCLCSLAVLGAAHTCTPTCARLPLLPPQSPAPRPAPASCRHSQLPRMLQVPLPVEHLPPWQLLQTIPAVLRL